MGKYSSTSRYLRLGVHSVSRLWRVERIATDTRPEGGDVTAGDVETGTAKHDEEMGTRTLACSPCAHGHALD